MLTCFASKKKRWATTIAKAPNVERQQRVTDQYVKGQDAGATAKSISTLISYDKVAAVPAGLRYRACCHKMSLGDLLTTQKQFFGVANELPDEQISKIYQQICSGLQRAAQPGNHSFAWLGEAMRFCLELMTERPSTSPIDHSAVQQLKQVLQGPRVASLPRLREYCQCIATLLEQNDLGRALALALLARAPLHFALHELALSSLASPEDLETYGNLLAELSQFQQTLGAPNIAQQNWMFEPWRNEGVATALQPHANLRRFYLLANLVLQTQLANSLANAATQRFKDAVVDRQVTIYSLLMANENLLLALEDPTYPGVTIETLLHGLLHDASRRWLHAVYAKHHEKDFLEFFNAVTPALSSNADLDTFRLLDNACSPEATTTWSQLRLAAATAARGDAREAYLLIENCGAALDAPPVGLPYLAKHVRQCGWEYLSQQVTKLVDRVDLANLVALKEAWIDRLAGLVLPYTLQAIVQWSPDSERVARLIELQKSSSRFPHTKKWLQVLKRLSGPATGGSDLQQLDIVTRSLGEHYCYRAGWAPGIAFNSSQNQHVSSVYLHIATDENDVSPGWLLEELAERLTSTTDQPNRRHILMSLLNKPELSLVYIATLVSLDDAALDKIWRAATLSRHPRSQPGTRTALVALGLWELPDQAELQETVTPAHLAAEYLRMEKLSADVSSCLVGQIPAWQTKDGPTVALKASRLLKMLFKPEERDTCPRPLRKYLDWQPNRRNLELCDYINSNVREASSEEHPATYKLVNFLLEMEKPAGHYAWIAATNNIVHVKADGAQAYTSLGEQFEKTLNNPGHLLTVYAGDLGEAQIHGENIPNLGQCCRILVSELLDGMHIVKSHDAIHRSHLLGKLFTAMQPTPCLDGKVTALHSFLTDNHLTESDPATVVNLIGKHTAIDQAVEYLRVFREVCLDKHRREHNVLGARSAIFGDDAFLEEYITPANFEVYLRGTPWVKRFGLDAVPETLKYLEDVLAIL